MTYDIVKGLNEYFQDNWSATPIQFEGQILDVSSEDDWISLTYSPVNNTLVGLDGTGCGRIDTKGLWKVFCYAKNPTKAYKLADDVKAFFNGKQIGSILAEVGQDGTAVTLDNTWCECLCYFTVVENS